MSCFDHSFKTQVIIKQGQRSGLSSPGVFPSVPAELRNGTQNPSSRASVALKYLKEPEGSQSHGLSDPQEWHSVDRRHNVQVRKDTGSSDGCSWRSRATFLQVILSQSPGDRALFGFPSQNHGAAPNSPSVGCYDPFVLNNLVNTWALKAFFLSPLFRD